MRRTSGSSLRPHSDCTKGRKLTAATIATLNQWPTPIHAIDKIASTTGTVWVTAKNQDDRKVESATNWTTFTAMIPAIPINKRLLLVPEKTLRRRAITALEY